jgi:hypothetical protein
MRRRVRTLPTPVDLARVDEVDPRGGNSDERVTVRR